MTLCFVQSSRTRCKYPAGGMIDAGLALDRLDQEGHRVRPYRGLQRFGVAERHDAEARREGPEAAARLRVGGEADDGDRAAVEVVGADDDLGLVRRARP